MDEFPTPLFRKGIALIRTYDSSQMLRWLAVYCRQKRALNFVMGDRIGKEAFRETVIRETAWQLEIERNDFLTSKMAQLNLEFREVLSHSSIEVHYHVAFYNVEVYRSHVLDVIRDRRDLVWVTSDEICRGKTSLGVPFDSTLRQLIHRSGVIQHWDSANSPPEM